METEVLQGRSPCTLAAKPMFSVVSLQPSIAFLSLKYEAIYRQVLKKVCFGNDPKRHKTLEWSKKGNLFKIIS